MKSLKVNNLYVQYNFAALALQNINFDISQGQILTVLAPLESGKTSLIKSLAGLVKISRGEVFSSGKNITVLPIKDRNASVLYDDLGLFDSKTVFYNLMYPLKIRNVDSAIAQQKINEILQEFELTSIKDIKIKKLSLQEKFEVALARLFVRESDYYLVDDPLYTFKDDLRAKMFEKMLPYLRKLSNLAPVVYATSSIEETKTLKDNVIILNYGVQLQSGSLASITAKPKNVLTYRLFRENAIVEESHIYNGEKGLYLTIRDREILIEQDKLINAIYIDSCVLVCYTLDGNDIDIGSLLIFDKNSEKLIYFD